MKKARRHGGTEARRGTAAPSSPFVRSSRAFTLIEVMIAVVIVGIMAGVVTYATVGMLDRAKRKRVISDISLLVDALELYHGEHGSFPTNREGLSVVKDVKLKNDPWGHPYQYVAPGRNGPYDIICFGADGREGGSGADADITNSDPDVVSGGGKK